MVTESLLMPVSSSIGSVSAQYTIPEKSDCILTLAHGAGAGMNHPFMKALASRLAENGIGTLLFNFPFIENKKNRTDVPVVAHKTIEAALSRAREAYPSMPLFAGGKSFGGRMSSQYLAAHPNPNVKGLIFYGFPLHPAKQPSVERAEHLKQVTTPMLFLQGTRDDMATPELMESVCSSLPQAILIKIEGADHGFKAGKQDTMQVLVNATREWVDKILGAVS